MQSLNILISSAAAGNPPESPHNAEPSRAAGRNSRPTALSVLYEQERAALDDIAASLSQSNFRAAVIGRDQLCRILDGVLIPSAARCAPDRRLLTTVHRRINDAYYENKASTFDKAGAAPP